VSGQGDLWWEITIEGIEAANAKVDVIASDQARNAPIISRGKHIPVETYLQRVGAAQKAISLNSEHPEDLVEPYDQIMPSRRGSGLKRISGPADGEEVFGNTSTVYGPAGARGRGNHFYCTTATTLTEHRLYLNMTASSDMQFLVYEGDVQAGVYNLINVSEIASSGTGEGWYSSGPISVPLVAGKYYMIYPQWTQSANYYADLAASPYPIPTSFGELQMGVGFSYAPTYTVPAAVTQTVPSTAFGSPTAYYQTIVTGGADWLSVSTEMDTVLVGQTQDVDVTFNAAGLLGGDYYANIIVSGNDPANLADTVFAHLFVIGAAVCNTSPEPLDFGQLFYTTSADLGLWVKNDGNGVMNVSDITSSIPEFTVNQTAFDVPPFDSVEVMVTFTPSAVGTFNGTLTITSNANNSPYVANVMGEAVEPPSIGVVPSEITEGVAVGDTVYVPVEVSNNAVAGAANLDWSCTLVVGEASFKTTPFTGVYSDKADARFTTTEPPSQITTLVTENAWDLQKNFNLETITGALGNAGAEFDGTYFYSTRWASNLIHKIDGQGNLVEEFSIPGVTGLRDLAYDGTYFYGGAAANTIYMMDFATKTLIGTISSPVAVRFIAYDEANDAFWCGTWADPPTLVDRNGTALATITTGLAGQYGAAYDSYSAGGPYLWIFDQGSGAGLPQLIHQFDIASGTATGFTHDVLAELGPNAAAIAGGLWVGEGVVPGKASIGGVLQGTPDVHFAYELAGANTWMSMDPTTPNSGTVAPGDVGGFIVRLHPIEQGIFTGSVVITSNDPNLPEVIIPVDVNTTGIAGEELLPTTYAVNQNYPNPFNPSTTIKYQLPQTSDVQLQIFNVLGQKVRTLVNSRVEAGYHEAIWDGRNDLGHQVASGIYIYKFQAGNFQKTLKLMLLK
jgi:hypothetical protein